MKNISWGIIGLGNVAFQFSRNFSSINNAKLLAVASKDYKKIDLYKKNFSLENKYCFDDYLKLICCEKIDIVYLALPNSFHYEWIVHCINQNKHILVEKPITQNFLQMEKIAKLASTKQVKIIEGFMYKFFPQIEKITDIIKSGEIGKIVKIQSNFGINLLTKKKFFFFYKRRKINLSGRLFNKNLGGGAILDLGCYPVSLTTMMLEKLGFKDLHNFIIKDKKVDKADMDVDVDSKIKIEFVNEVNAELNCSFKKNIGSETKIIGSHGSILINNTWLNPNKILVKSKDREYELIFDRIENAYLNEIEYISKNLYNNSINKAGMNLHNSLLNMKILDKWKN